MVYRGHIENGNIVIDDPAKLDDGTKVEIRVVSTAPVSSNAVERPWLRYLGTFDNLPPDASMTIDQVLYGRPEE